MLRDGQGAKIRTSGFREVVTIIPQRPEDARMFLRDLKRLSPIRWHVSAAIPKNLVAWEKLKRARTQKEMWQAAKSIRNWARCLPRGEQRQKFPGFILAHANDLLRAKGMSSYPGDQDRGKSDNKRIIFLAKVLAGLMFGLSPSYAIKRLAHWAYDEREWLMGPFAAMEKSFGGRIVEGV